MGCGQPQDPARRTRHRPRASPPRRCCTPLPALIIRARAAGHLLRLAPSVSASLDQPSMLAAAAFFAVAVEVTSAAPLITTAMTAAAPLNPTVGDVIKHHANLTSFAASLESANLSSFLGEPTAFGVFGYSVLAPSDAAFSALPEAMKGMFDVGSLRYEILSHHINLRTTTPNAVCAGAAAALPGYNVTTMASQTLSILCYTCPATGSTGDACPTVLAKHTLGNATFTITATPSSPATASSSSSTASSCRRGSHQRRHRSGRRHRRTTSRSSSARLITRAETAGR